MEFLKDWPYPVAVAVLFLIVLLRGNGTYWLGRAAHAGAKKTRMSRLLHTPAFQRAQRLISRWGAPVITVSFLTVGFQTLVNLAAGATRMPLRRYLPAMIVGCILWAFLYATVGFVTFAAWLRLYDKSPAGAIALLVVLAAALTIFIVRQVRNRNDPAVPEPGTVASDR